MGEIRHQLVRTVLTGLNLSRLDRLFAAMDTACGVILTLHHVRSEPDHEFAPNAHLSVTPEFLDETLKLMKERGIDVVSMDEAQRRISGHNKGKFAVFTFDDAYRDNAENAFPIMARHQAPYALYVATGLVDGTADLWWEGLELLVRQLECIDMRSNGDSMVLFGRTPSQKQVAFETLLNHMRTEVAEPDIRDTVRDLCEAHGIDLDAHRRSELMTWDEIREVASDPLCTIGGHTVQHCALSRLKPENVAGEMREGADVLEQKTGTRPVHFAYPYGFAEAAGKREFEIARKMGFKTAVTTRPGLVYPEHADHLTALPRISMNGHFQQERFISPLISGLPTRLARGFRKLDVV